MRQKKKIGLATLFKCSHVVKISIFYKTKIDNKLKKELSSSLLLGKFFFEKSWYLNLAIDNGIAGIAYYDIHLMYGKHMSSDSYFGNIGPYPSFMKNNISP